MIAAKTIVGLACLLSQGTPLDKLDPEKTFSDAEQALLISLGKDGACLPEAFEVHVKQTEEKIRRGELVFESASSPTRETGGL